MFLLLILSVLSPLRGSVTGVEFGILDESVMANSDGSASPGEKVLLLFSIHDPNFPCDSVMPLSGQGYTTHNFRFDRSRQRGNLEFTVLSELVPDTSVRIRIIAFGNRRQDTLIFKVPVVFPVDSIKTETAPKNVLIKIYHQSFIEHKFQRIVRIRRFPDLWDTSVLASYFDTNALFARFENIEPGLYSAEIILNAFSSTTNLKNPVSFFFVSNGHKYDYVMLTDIGDQQSGMGNSMELSQLINESSELGGRQSENALGNAVILPFSFATEDVWKKLCEPAAIIFVKAGENAAMTDELSSRINAFAEMRPVILLGSTTLKAFVSENLNSFREFPFLSSVLTENLGVSGYLCGVLDLKEYFSASLVLTCEANETLLSATDVPIVVKSGNYYVVFPQYHTCTALYPSIVDNILAYLSSGNNQLVAILDSMPVEIKNVYPNPVGASGASFLLEARSSGTIKLFIADVTGREVSTVFEGRIEPGQHVYFWNGRDLSGSPLPKSLYFATGVFMSGGEIFQTTHKITLF